jgi:hypothetical protein
MYTTNTSNNFLVPHSVTEDIKFIKQTASAKYLYTILCKLANRYSDDKGWFWRSMRNLAQDCGLNTKTVSKAKQELLKNEFIDVKHTFYQHSKKRTYDSYRLNGFRFISGVKNGV